MKKQRVIILIAILLIVACALCACDNKEDRDLNGFIGDMKSSMASVKSISANISMHDSNVLVYEYQRNMQINGSTASVESTEKTLSSSFKLDTNTSTSTINDIDTSTLLPIALSEWSVENVVVESDKFSCTIPVENFASVLKVGSYKISESATLSCTFEGEHLTNITCNFITDDGKTVAVTYDFAY